MNMKYMQEYKEKLPSQRPKSKACKNTGITKPECSCTPCLDEQVGQFASHLLKQERSKDESRSRISRAA